MPCLLGLCSGAPQTVLSFSERRCQSLNQQSRSRSCAPELANRKCMLMKCLISPAAQATFPWFALQTRTPGGLEEGVAFLPWEEWLARLGVAIRRRSYKTSRTRELVRTASWRKTEGTVHRVTLDFFNPQEKIDCFYSTKWGYHSGSYWHWLDPANLGQIRKHDRILLGYDPADHQQSVFLRMLPEPNPLAIPPNLRLFGDHAQAHSKLLCPGSAFSL